MKFAATILAAALAITMISSPKAVAAQDAGKPDLQASAWAWPLPPDKPRVQHIKTLITPEDLGVKKGFWAKVWEFIAGKDTADRILSPNGIVSDGKGKVYVVDWGAGCIHFFDFEKKKYNQFNKTKNSVLVSPVAAALDAKGNLYVTDSRLKRVFVFSGKKNKRIIGEDGIFLRPTGIAINRKDGLLYVVDTSGHRVDILDLEGNRIDSIGKRGSEAGEFNYPTHIAADAAGDVYVMDSLNFRVQIFDKAGKFITQFGGNGTSIHDFMKPKGIAVDSEGHVWVSDSLRNSVQAFDRSGRLLLIFGKAGIGAGQFNVPMGLFMDDNDRLYVSDSYNFRVQMFQYLKAENRD